MSTRKPTSTTSASSGAEVVALPQPDHTPEQIEAAKKLAEDRDLAGWLDWLARPEKKIAIVGFTASKDEAPWDDPTFEKWPCNNLHRFLRPDQPWDRLFDLHDYKTISSDKEHEAFLRTCPKPVVVWDPRPEWPTSVAFPKDQVLASVGRYMTNSISWMVAAALLEGVTELHVYGVDLAQGTEYAQQRPSCEYMLGIAQGRGVKVYIPLTSDLLKSGSLYGVDDDSFIHAKITSREKELNERMNMLQAQYNQINNQIHQVMGARENNAYYKGVWLNPRANRDGTPKVESNGRDAKPAEAPAEAGA